MSNKKAKNRDTRPATADEVREAGRARTTASLHYTNWCARNGGYNIARHTPTARKALEKLVSLDQAFKEKLASYEKAYGQVVIR